MDESTRHEPAFSLAAEALVLPPGASARTARRVLTVDGRRVLAFTQGPFRTGLHPVLTPSGHCVTAERPADHPHHAGIWIASDRVTWRAEGGPGEPHTYNFYVDEVFQGRAPGSILERTIESDTTGRVVQSIEWRGPGEWGAPTGRTVLDERRETTVKVFPGGYTIDVASEIAPVGGSVEIGPTRHALFNVRVADVMSLAGAGRTIDSAGRCGGDAISGRRADWVCFTGPVGGDEQASVAVSAGPGSGGEWFVADWGVLTVGPFRDEGLVLEPGTSRAFAYQVVVTDGAADAEVLTSRHREFAARTRQRES